MADEDPNILSGPKLPFIIPKITLGEFLFAKLKTHDPESLMIREADTGREVSPRIFLKLCLKVAASLKEVGLEPKDIVSVIGKTGVDVYAIATGTLFLGGVVSPLDPNLDPDIFKHLLETIQPKLLFCDSEMSKIVLKSLSTLENMPMLILLNANPEEEYPVQIFENFIEGAKINAFQPFSSNEFEDTPAFLICSSGTMGIPKPVMLTHKNLLYQTLVWKTYCTVSNKLLACPVITFSFFFWVSGVIIYLGTLYLNTELTIVQKTEANLVLRTIEKVKPTWGLFAPALVKYLTNHPNFKNYNVSSLVMMMTGGCSLEKSIAETLQDSWGEQLICKQSYGATETTGIATISAWEDDILSVGKLLPGFQVKIIGLDDGRILGPGKKGELFIKSPSIMKGYLGNEEATKQVLFDGWYRSGDVAYYNEKGLIYIKGRKKDFIQCNGVLVNPVEIEDAIITVPGVVDVGVVGIDVDGDIQLAALVVKVLGYNIKERNIIQYIREELPQEKHLTGGVKFVETIPKTASGKMKRMELQSLAASLFFQ